MRYTVRTRLAVVLGRLAAWASRRLGTGGGSVIAGRVALRLCPDVLARLARGRTSIVVTGTNGKTTTSHLVAAALRGRGPVAHNASGSNMVDGATAALILAPRARLCVLEVDELHLAPVLDAVRPDVLVLLNLSRDQLDRVSEVRATARGIAGLLRRHPDTVVVANADDPLVVWAAGASPRVEWVSAGTRWRADTLACPTCGQGLDRPAAEIGTPWSCPGCGLHRPCPRWWYGLLGAGGTAAPAVHRVGAAPVPLSLSLPGRVNLGNATLAVAAAAAIGTDPVTATARLGGVREVAGRYGRLAHRGRLVRTVLVKNPAGWGEALDVLTPGRPLLMVINAGEADGRDVSWLWDLCLDALADRVVAASGDRAADLGVRLSYADVAHYTDPDPLVALEHLPVGEVDAVANYTAFLRLQHRLAPGGTTTVGRDGHGY